MTLQFKENPEHRADAPETVENKGLRKVYGNVIA